MSGPYNGDDKCDMLFYGHGMGMAFVNSQQLEVSAQTQASKHLGKGDHVDPSCQGELMTIKDSWRRQCFQ